MGISTPGGDYFGNARFYVTDKFLEAHAAHKLEEDSTALDGKHVEVVVQPAVIAYGNEDGKAYDKHKIWAKAVVWLSQMGSEDVRMR